MWAYAMLPRMTPGIGADQRLEGRLTLGDRESPVVQRPADDHAGEAPGAPATRACAGGRASRRRPSRAARHRSGRQRPSPRAAPRGWAPRGCRPPRPACRRTCARHDGRARARAPRPRSRFPAPSPRRRPSRSGHRRRRLSDRRARRRGLRPGPGRAAPPCRAPPSRRPRPAPRPPPRASRRPPPHCTGTPDSEQIRAMCSRFAGIPRRAPSRSTTCRAPAPCSSHRRAASTGSASYTVSRS